MQHSCPQSVNYGIKWRRIINKPARHYLANEYYLLARLRLAVLSLGVSCTHHTITASNACMQAAKIMQCGIGFTLADALAHHIKSRLSRHFEKMFQLWAISDLRFEWYCSISLVAYHVMVTEWSRHSAVCTISYIYADIWTLCSQPLWKYIHSK